MKTGQKILVTSETILWVGDEAAPPNLVQAAADRWELSSASPEAVADNLVGVAVAVVSASAAGLDGLLSRLGREGIVMIVLDGKSDVSGDRTMVLDAPVDISAEELTGVLTAAACLVPSLKQLRTGLAEAEMLAREAARTADEIDEEMRMASRLQQDFLPHRLPAIGTVRFGVHYQPAGFVSGDIYDVVRLDETHVGFYIADAVGHGMPAALLTMFIKKALQTKRITGHSYEIIPPHEAMAQLNADLCRQNLSMCEFCTAIYGVVDTSSLTVTLSRAGHPAPVLLRGNDTVEELEMSGPLLGILETAEFESYEISLVAGDRLIFYSDGVEETLCGKGKSRTKEMVDVLSPVAGLGREDMLQYIADQAVLTDSASDDVTVLLLEVLQQDVAV
jgi:serine phosphatase RsbU (regulator of sigma subunit)